jgi:hypothetical protein
MYSTQDHTPFQCSFIFNHLMNDKNKNIGGSGTEKNQLIGD